MPKFNLLPSQPGQPANLDDERVRDILTEAQLATELTVLPRTLRLWRHTRGLPHIKLTSKIIRYRRADIDAWLERNRVVIG